MRSGLPKILVTGGAGFIGSAFVRLAIRNGCSVIVIDKLTYAGDLKRLKEMGKRYTFYKTDISNKKQMASIFKKERPRILLNFSAETHVDRSILDSRIFMETNILGTQVLLDISRDYGIEKFIHLSTDEVYGEIKKGKFSEDSALQPNSPYAASKAAADLLIKAYARTYGFPAIIIRPSNNYGPWQYPEKLIPLAILKILRNEKIPVYAKGENIREWLYVEDCVDAILQIIKKGKSGEIYNLGSNKEMRNIEVIRMILNILNASPNLIKFVKDRPGHDIRYKLNSQKIFKETGWKPKIKFENGIQLTVEWCLGHKDWLLSKSKDIAKLYL